MSHVSFNEFARLIEECGAIKPNRKGQARNGSPRILSILQRWITRLPNDLRPGIGRIVFRLLFPDLDVRRRYGMQETMLSKMLIEAMHWRDERGSLAQWASADDEISRKSGFLGEQVQQAIDRRQSGVGLKPMDIFEVDSLLEELAQASSFSATDVQRGPKRRDARHVIYDLYSRLDGLQASVMTQIILKDLRPLLYKLPSLNRDLALMDYNANAYHELTVHEALEIWHADAPAIFRVHNLLDRTLDIVEKLPRVRPTSPSERQAYDIQLAEYLRPTVGVLVEIPKAVKGQGCRHALEHFGRDRIVYAETKYDGERMQIHIDLDARLHDQIKIYSKSKRESTQDRRFAKPIILAALGLPREKPDTRMDKRAPVTSAAPKHRQLILEAELVVYHEGKQRVDEFYKLEALLGRPPGGQPWRVPHANDVPSSQILGSQDTDDTASFRPPTSKDLHLAVVFFDVLRLGERNLLPDTYETRRRLLEQTIKPIEGFAMLAERTEIDTSNRREALKALEQAFDRTTAAREEGLVLKAAHSTYNDLERRWVKLKRDYDPTTGDTHSFAVLAAGWKADRARDLRVPPNTFTSFLVGLQTNRLRCKADPSTKPDFIALFVCDGYGLSREQLAALNVRIEHDPACDIRAHNERICPFTFKLADGVKFPSGRLFDTPLVFEMYGAGWTRCGDSKLYELRFPRIKHVHTRTDRRFSDDDVLDIESSQDIARHATRIVGKGEKACALEFETELRHEFDDQWSHWKSKASSVPPATAPVERAGSPSSIGRKRTPSIISISSTSTKRPREDEVDLTSEAMVSDLSNELDAIEDTQRPPADGEPAFVTTHEGLTLLVDGAGRPMRYFVVRHHDPYGFRNALEDGKRLALLSSLAHVAGWRAQAKPAPSMAAEPGAVFVARDADEWQREVEQGLSGLIKSSNTAPIYVFDIDALRQRNRPLMQSCISVL